MTCDDSIPNCTQQKLNATYATVSKSANYRLDEEKILAGVLQNLENLRLAIVDGKARFEEADTYWGGAGVVVMDQERPEEYPDDFVVRLQDPRPLVWLIERLKAVCRPIISWANKEPFYGRIAEVADAYAAQHGQRREQAEGMLLAVMDTLLEELSPRLQQVEPERQRLLDAVRSLI
jgi:hypothetical protein